MSSEDDDIPGRRFRALLVGGLAEPSRTMSSLPVGGRRRRWALEQGQTYAFNKYPLAVATPGFLAEVS